jgi:hypothetical protein
MAMIMLMKLYITLLLTLVAAFSIFGQLTPDDRTEGQVNFDRPMIYLDYVCSENGKIRLRLFNNTVWAINITSDQYYLRGEKVKLANGSWFYTPPDDKEISLSYRVDKFALPWTKVKVPEFPISDSGVANWIASNHSVIFSVPGRYLTKKLQIYVDVAFEWESRKGRSLVGGVEHRVSFRGIDLPGESRNCK